MRPIGIRETLRRAIAKLVMRAERDQEKTLCGSLQLCAGIEAGIEGANHTVVQRQTRGQKGRRTRVWCKQAGQRGQGRQR